MLSETKVTGLVHAQFLTKINYNCFYRTRFIGIYFHLFHFGIISSDHGEYILVFPFLTF